MLGLLGLDGSSRKTLVYCKSPAGSSRMDIRASASKALGFFTNFSGRVNASERSLSEVPEDNGFIWSGHVLPEEIIVKIFCYMPAKDLIKSAVIVCKSWHRLLSQQHVWFSKLKAEGITLSSTARARLLEQHDENSIIYVLQSLCSGKCAFNKNLILNPSGRDKFKHWNVFHGGDRMKIECPPVGSDEIPKEAGVPTQHCFVTSFQSCTRKQVIDLERRGLHPRIIDALRPEIHITEWVGARWDCNSCSNVMVKLEGANNSMEVKMEWSSLDDNVVCRYWYKMAKVIVDYPEGLKKITFISSGKDHQFWAGHYGAKTAGSSVVLAL